MNNTFQALNTVFNIPNDEDTNNDLQMDVINTEYQDEKIINHDVDLDQDLTRTRENLFSLLEKGEDALDNILSVAKQSESPRCYEVFSSMLKNLADINHQILDIHKKKSELNKYKSSPEDNKTPNVINNSLFIGSTNELQQLIADTKKRG